MNSKQHKYDIAYLKMALEWGQLSHCKRKQVGALIVKNREIIITSPGRMVGLEPNPEIMTFMPRNLILTEM